MFHNEFVPKPAEKKWGTFFGFQNHFTNITFSLLPIIIPYGKYYWRNGLSQVQTWQNQMNLDTDHSLTWSNLTWYTNTKLGGSQIVWHASTNNTLACDKVNGWVHWIRVTHNNNSWVLHIEWLVWIMFCFSFSYGYLLLSSQTDLCDFKLRYGILNYGFWVLCFMPPLFIPKPASLLFLCSFQNLLPCYSFVSTPELFVFSLIHL